jgi:peptide/nickel transport system substrate-binding protein
VGDVSSAGSFSLRRRRALHLPGIPGGNLDRIGVRVVQSPGRQVRAVIAGSLDYTPDPAPTDLLPLIRSKYRDRYGEQRTLSSNWLAMNGRRKPFDDERVRRAVNYAVDGGRLERLTLGFLEPSCNLIPRDMPGYRRLDPCPYGSRIAPANLVKARGLVDRANARGARVTVLASRVGEGPVLSRYFVSTLRKIGLRARRRLVAGAVAPRRRDQAWLDSWHAGLPHPAEPLRLVRGQDAAIDVETAALSRQPLDADNALDDWADLDRQLVDAAYVAPFGADKRSTLLSERLDFANCSRFHPVYGSDWSSFCLK